MKEKISSRHIAVCAMIAAVYTVLCLATPLLSYGMIQVRVAEALTLLPVLSPVAIWGVTLGCAVSNFVGWITGANPIGGIDTVVGTSATLIAGIITYRLRDVRAWGLPIASAMAPVVVNAIIIGGQLSIVFAGSLHPVIFLTNALWVAVGQMIACVALGLPLLKAIERNNFLGSLFYST